MAFVSVAAGQRIRATHVTQFSQWLSGVKLDTPGTIAATHASDYALTVFSNNTGAGNALKIQYGASASSATTIATFNATGVGFGQYGFGASSITFTSASLQIGGIVLTPTSATLGNSTFNSTSASIHTHVTVNSSGATITGFRDKGGFVHDIRAYGAVADADIVGGVWTGTNNAAAIQSAIDAAAAGSSSHQVYIPGVFGISTSLDLTMITGGITLIGDGHQNSRIVALAGTGLPGKPMLDMVGSGHMQLIDLGIGDTANATTPGFAILMADTTTANVSAEHRFERIKVDGSYSTAAWYNAGGASSRFHDCIFSNSYHSAATPTVYLTTNNSGSATSAFVQIGTAAAAVSDLDFHGCEFHSNYVSGVSLMGYPLRLDGNAGDLKFFGGILDGGADRLVSYSSSGGASPGDISFMHMLHRQADGATEPTYVHYLATAGMTVSNLKVIGGSQTAHTSGAIFGGASAVTLINPYYNGRPTNSASKIAYFGGSNAHMSSPEMWCYGQQFNIGTNGTLVNYRLYGVGTITASSTRAGMSSSAAGLPNFMTGITLGAGPANVGAAIRMSNGDGIYALNAAATGSILVASKDGSDNVNVGQISGMAKTFINATTGVDLVVGTTTRLMATTTGVNVTGAFLATTTLTANTALRAGSSNFATTGGVRLTNNNGIYSRNTSNNADIPLANLDGADNLTIGAQSGLSLVQIYSQNGHRFRTGGYYEFAATAASVTATVGFVCLTSSTGAPTGTPGPTAGNIPVHIDTSGGRLYAFYGSAWHYVAFT